jgi:hypothetical protein
MSAFLTGLTDDAAQQYPIKLPDGSTVSMTLYYRPQQVGWWYDLSWDGQTPPWQFLGNRLVAGPNILRQFRNQIPFGLGVSTTTGLDPAGQEDFVNGACTLMLLDASDVIDVEEGIYPGN